MPEVTQAPTTSAPQVRERQVDRQPVIPRRFYSRVVGGAPVVPVQLDGNAIVPPSDPQVLGWWGSKAGSRKGTTLLVGHTVHTGGGFLDNLEDIPVGSTVGVSGVQYTVTSNRVISKATLAEEAQTLFSQTGPAKLIVVTCEDYDSLTGHYSSNVVLVAH